MNPTNRSIRSAVANRFTGLLIALAFGLALLACTKEAKEQPEIVEPKPEVPPPEMAAPVPPVPPPPPVAPEPQVASTEPTKAPEPIAPGDEWTIQVGSFTRKENASRLLASLQSKGYQAYVVEAIAGGKTHYRVRVGRLATEKEARALEQTIETKEGLSNAYAVKQSP